MKLPRALKALALPPTVVLAGWFFSCFLLLTVSSLFLWKRSTASKENPAVLAANDQQEQPQNPSPDEQTPDERITILEQFLSEQNSPLAPQAAAMVEAADTYKFNWRLLPAIAGRESSYGKNIPWDAADGQPSHNAWGWGVYGQKAPSFSSWEEAIKIVAEGLRHEYYNEGYITPELIVKKFTPRSDGSWERDVKTIMVALSAMEQIAPEEKENGSKD